MKRRDFLINTAGTAGLFLISSCVPKNNSLVESHSKFIIGHENESNKTYSLLVTDTNGEHTYIEAPCKAHGPVVNPKNSSLAFGSSKWGQEAYLADIKNGKLQSSVRAGNGKAFYGHSLYSTNGEFIFASMMNHETQQGYISVRKSDTLEEVKTISTYGREPHQLQWMEADKTIAVINSTPLLSQKEQLHSMLSIINVQNGELVKSFKTSTRRHSHFSLTNNQSIAIICRAGSAQDMTLYEALHLGDGRLIVGQETSPLVGDRNEGLSHVLFEDKSLAIITVVGLNRIVFWDYLNNKVLYIKDFADKPQGIIRDRSEKNILVSFYNKEKSYINVYKMDKLLKFDFSAYSTMAGASGSHFAIV